MTANPRMIQYWASRNKCVMCKRRFESPYLLPAPQPTKTFSPNFNVEAIFHMSDTHGIPHDVSRQWIIGRVYGLTLDLFGVKELRGSFIG